MPPRITTLSTLHHYLYVAMQIEHATIPPYLMAMYSIHPGTNSDAVHILRVVVVEEMLHLTLAANLLNAVNGKPDLTTPDFVPEYPAGLPNGEEDFVVDLQPFSWDAVQNFLEIERREPPPSSEPRMIRRRPIRHSFVARPLQPDPDLHYCTIGDFYEEIRLGIEYLYAQNPSGLFTGNPDKQIGPEYYYSGGGRLLEVTNIGTAREAIRIIVEQGEGFGGGIFNEENELAHFYRFEQLQLGRYYEPGNTPGQASGPPLEVDWNAVYPVAKNPKLKHYQNDPELFAAAGAFNADYARFLALLTRAYNGERQLLTLEAVPAMFKFRDRMNQLIRNPIPGSEYTKNAGPTFEMPGAAAAAQPAATSEAA